MSDTTIIKLRRDLAANWTTANPVLAEGELGVELDTKRAKLGDGETAWAALGYWNLGMRLDDLVDVDLSTTPPVPGQVLVVDEGGATWVSGESQTLPDIPDLTLLFENGLV